MKRTLGQEPFILQLVTLLASDNREQGEAKPIANRTCGILMAVAGVGAFLYGSLSGLIPL